jgi:hypothetical protein
VHPLSAQDAVTADTITQYVEDSTNYEDESDSVYIIKRAITDYEWQSITNDSSFNYKSEREADVVLTPPKQYNNKFGKIFQAIITFIFSKVGRIIVWILVFAILAFVFVQIIKGDIGFVFSRRNKIVATNTPENDAVSPDDLIKANWELKIANALKIGDRRLATRYAFMYILQLLHQRQYLHYSIDKTNFEYYMAIENKEMQQLYRKLLLRYEFAWFGKFEVSENDWQQTNELITLIKSKF